MPEWTPEDEHSMRTYYPHSTNVEMAQILGGRHSAKQCRDKARVLGILKTKEQRRKSSQDARRLRLEEGEDEPD